KVPTIAAAASVGTVKELVGLDVFIDYPPVNPAELGEKLRALKTNLQFQFLSNRGQKVWPDVTTDTMLVDHWRARYMAADGTRVDNNQVVEVLSVLADAGIDFIKTEHLYNFDGKAAFSA